MDHTIVETAPLATCDRSNKRKAKKRKKSMPNNPEDISLHKKSHFDGGLSQSPLIDHSINVMSKNMEIGPSKTCDRSKELKAKKKKKRKKSKKNEDSKSNDPEDISLQKKSCFDGGLSQSPLTDHSINVMSQNMEMAPSTICDQSKELKEKKRKKRKNSNKNNDSMSNNDPEDICLQKKTCFDGGLSQSSLTDHSINVMSENIEMAPSTLCGQSKEPKAKKRKKQKKSNKNNQQQQHLPNGTSLTGSMGGQDGCTPGSNKNNDSIIMAQSHVNPELRNVKLSSLVVKAAGQSSRKLLILDLNGLLADIRYKPVEGYPPNKCMARRAVYVRPFCQDFLNFCFATFDVGVWSSRRRESMECITKFLMKSRREKLKFCLNQGHCMKTGYKTIENKGKPIFFKELQMLWDKRWKLICKWEDGLYNESNTLLIDDSPYKALLNPPYTGIFPNSYEYNHFEDNSLGPKGELRLYLTRLAAADNVQEFVKENPIGQSPITNAHPSWDFYSKVNQSVSKNMKQQKELKPMPQANKSVSKSAQKKKISVQVGSKKLSSMKQQKELKPMPQAKE